MGRFGFALLSSVLALGIAPAAANAATIINLSAGQNGALSGTFENTVKIVGSFSDMYTFDLPSAGLTSATISTVALTSVNDIDFLSVLLNGTALGLTFPDPDDTSGTPGGVDGPLEPSDRIIEFGSLAGLPTAPGSQSLTVNGVSGGNGSYSGTLSFTPTGAVPEPSTWALMLLGFGLVGFGMRRRRRGITTSGGILHA